VVKNPPANAGDAGLIPGSGRFPGEGNGNPLQYSYLEIPRTEEPGRLESRLESQRVRYDLMTKQQQQQSINNKTGLINTMRTCLSSSTVFKLHQNCLLFKLK